MAINNQIGKLFVSFDYVYFYCNDPLYTITTKYLNFLS